MLTGLPTAVSPDCAAGYQGTYWSLAGVLTVCVVATKSAPKRARSHFQLREEISSIVKVKLSQTEESYETLYHCKFLVFSRSFRPAVRPNSSFQFNERNN
jgi:hypothetical protein